MSADTVSSLFPNRPLRPLPKRSLRDRLPPGLASTIQYPPAPQTITPLFSYPYSLRDDEPGTSRSLSHRIVEAEQRQSRRTGPGTEAGEEHTGPRRSTGSRAISDSSHRLGRQAKSEQNRHSVFQSPLSAASSVDGYDAFENSNNKKKRKIPTAGDSALNAVHTVGNSGSGSAGPKGGSGVRSAAVKSVESQGEMLAPAPAIQHGSASFLSGTQNVPGPGRGRFGRQRSGRSPLHPLSDCNNNWVGRGARPRSSRFVSDSVTGQENISLLHQMPPSKLGPLTSRFTFTLPEIATSLTFPGHDVVKTNMQRYQTSGGRLANNSWHRVSQMTPTGQRAAAARTVDATSKDTLSKAGVAGQGGPSATHKASRRSVAREYLAAARARRKETLEHNRRHPPDVDQIWICHFCEYEAIFGHPPEALVRQYEIKERKQRQLEQQRRAQWERLKKGKNKGKKSSKVPTKTADAGHEAQAAAENHGSVMNSSYSQGTQSDEYYEEEDYEDDEYEPDEDIHPEHGSQVPPKHDGIRDQAAPGFAVDDGGGT